MPENDLVNLPIEMKYLILSFLPIHYLIESFNDESESNEYISYIVNDCKKYFIKSATEINNFIVQYEMNYNSLNWKKEEYEYLRNLIINNNLNNFKEMKLLSRFILKNNFILFLDHKRDQLINILTLLNINSLEICWIFTKEEILNYKLSKIGFYEKHCNLYLILLNTIVKDKKFIDEMTNDIFRLHALLYIVKNQVKINILKVINIDKPNENIKIINLDQMKLFKNKNYYSNEIIFQNIIKGNRELLLKYESQPSNLKLSINYCLQYTSKYLPFNYYGNRTWVKNIKLYFNPSSRDYHLKCKRSIFKLFSLFLDYEITAIILIEIILACYGYIFTFKTTRALIFTENSIFLKLFILLFDFFIVSQIVLLFKKDIIGNLDFYLKAGGFVLLKSLISFGFSYFGYKEDFIYLQYVEWGNNLLVAFIIYNLAITVKDIWKGYLKEGFDLFFVSKVEFLSRKEFKTDINLAKSKTKKSKSRKWMWPTIVGGLTSIAVAGVSYYVYNNYFNW
ncbi:hypothetical protein ABK040_012291 [Willaertia magna]